MAGSPGPLSSPTPIRATKIGSAILVPRTCPPRIPKRSHRTPEGCSPIAGRDGRDSDQHARNLNQTHHRTPAGSSSTTQPTLSHRGSPPRPGGADDRCQGRSPWQQPPESPAPKERRKHPNNTPPPRAPSASSAPHTPVPPRSALRSWCPRRNSVPSTKKRPKAAAPWWHESPAPAPRDLEATRLASNCGRHPWLQAQTEQQVVGLYQRWSVSASD